jgi:hypothetical protein
LERISVGLNLSLEETGTHVVEYFVITQNGLIGYSAETRGEGREHTLRREDFFGALDEVESVILERRRLAAETMAAGGPRCASSSRTPERIS